MESLSAFVGVFASDMNYSFDYYAADIKQVRPLGRCSMDSFIRAVRSPKPGLAEVFTKLRTETDPSVRASLKTHLYAFTPCVQISGRRRYADISAFTGLAVLDFDKIDNAPDFKQYLFETYPSVIAAWLSASGRGVRAFVNIPVVSSVDQFKLYFNALYYEMVQYNGCDQAPQNPVLPLFLSYDPEILVRDDSFVWDRQLVFAEPPPPPRKYDSGPDLNDRVFKAIKTAIDKIHDNGHPQLRAAAYALGGYVGSGAIEMDRAHQTIDYLIDTNHYLSIKPAVYKRTAREMIQKGIQSPLYI